MCFYKSLVFEHFRNDKMFVLYGCTDDVHDVE